MSKMNKTKILLGLVAALVAIPNPAYAHLGGALHALSHSAPALAIGALCVGFICLKLNKINH